MTLFPDPSSYVNNAGDLLPYANLVMDNMLGIGLLLALFTIFFISLKDQNSTSKALATSFFISLPFAVFFYIIGILNGYFLLLSVILTIISYASIKKEPFEG